LELADKIKKLSLENESVTVFNGINRAAKAEDGYFYRALNMSNSAYPALSVRGRRAIVRPVSSCDGICGDDTLIWAENGRLWYGANEVSGVYLAQGKKRLLRIGSYVLIFPDCVYWNISDPEDYGSISAYFSSESEVSVSLVDDNKSELSGFYIASKIPDTAVSGEICALVAGDDAPVIKRYDGYAFRTVDTYIKIAASGIGVGFNVGDTVECEGLTKYVGDHFTVAAKEANAIYCRGVILSNGSAQNVKIKRLMPYYDQITVSGNRVYAAYRGYDRSGRFVSKVYASDAGDPLNWSVYGGGMEADCELDGAFTGICDYLGQPIVFFECALGEIREKSGKIVITKVIGNGVQDGAFDSCRTIGYNLYYKGRNGIYSYDGSYPKCISLGLEEGIELAECGAPAGVCNGKYYIKITDNKSVNAIYVYDTFDKLWQKEDDCGVTAFASRGGRLYAMFEDPDALIEKQGIIMFGYDEASESEKRYCAALGYPIPEDKISWFCESGKIGVDDMSGMYPVRLTVRVKVKNGADMAVSLIYDDSETAERAVSIVNRTVGAVTVPIVIRKCDTVRVRFSGHGECEICGYGVSYQKGGETRGWR